MPRSTAFRIAILIGAALWIALMADFDAAEPGSYVNAKDTDGRLLVFLLSAYAAAPVLLGARFRDRAEEIALGLLAVPLALAWWTMPRGDGDGLWILIFPYLLFFAFVAYLAAEATGALVTWLGRRRAG